MDVQTFRVDTRSRALDIAHNVFICVEERSFAKFRVSPMCSGQNITNFARVATALYVMNVTLPSMGSVGIVLSMRTKAS